MPWSQERRRDNELKHRHRKCSWCGWIVVVFRFFNCILKFYYCVFWRAFCPCWLALPDSDLNFSLCFLVSLYSFVMCGCFKTVWGWIEKQNLVHSILRSNLGLFKLCIGLFKLDIWSAPVWYTEIYFLCGWSLQYPCLSINWWEEEMLVSWHPSKLIQREDFAMKLKISCRHLLLYFSFFLS